MLYILFESVTGATFYQDVLDEPGIMLRLNVNEERVVGINAHDVLARLMPDAAQDVAIRHLAQSLVKQFR